MNIYHKSKRNILILLCLMVALIFSSCSNTEINKAQGEDDGSYKIAFTDDLGKEIRMKEPAQRIISLYSAHTENLFAIGLDEEIIGVGRQDIYPPQSLEKPVFDYRSDPEKVIAAKPDVVLIRPFIQRKVPDFVAVLEKAGINVVTLYPEKFAEFDTYIQKLALLTGKEEQAANLLQDFHAGIDHISELTQNMTSKVQVYFESSENGYKTITPDSMAAKAIENAGGINVAKNAQAVTKGSSIAAFGAERILENGNDIDVFVSQRGAMNAGGNQHAISIRPGFSAIKAVKNNRVYVINEKIISSPNFRYIKGIKELTRMFYPEIVDDITRFAAEDVVTRNQMAEIAVRYKHKEIFVPTSKYYKKQYKGHTYGMFKDVAVDHPNFDFIETAVLSGYMESYKENGSEMFYPEQKITRGELAGILFMLHDLKDTQKKVNIKDINEVSNSRIVQIVVNNHLMQCDNGQFNPQQLVTGKEVVEALNQLKVLN